MTNLNATESAKKAGYSEKTAYSSGQRLLKRVEIKEYISKRMAEKDTEIIASQDEVLKLLIYMWLW
ncbi:MAG: terminase small subunit [Romboutsia sp.]